MIYIKLGLCQTLAFYNLKNDVNICIFIPTSRNGALMLCFEILNNDFKNSNKLKIILMFLFFVKIQYKSEESLPTPHSKQLPAFSPTCPFVGKIFYPHPYCQIRGSQQGGGFALCKLFLFIFINYYLCTVFVQTL